MLVLEILVFLFLYICFCCYIKHEFLELEPWPDFCHMKLLISELDRFLILSFVFIYIVTQRSEFGFFFFITIY